MRNNLFGQMDLNLLRVFALLMLEENVTRAAAKLHVSQSAVSNSLQRLRETLDDVLFERTATGIRPTTRARELWLLIAPHYNAIHDAFTPDAFDPKTFEGTFTIAMSDYTVERVMPGLGAHIAAHAPSMKIALTPFSIANIFHLFEREGIDMAIGANLDDARHARGIRSHGLWPIQAACLMRRDHPLSKGELSLERFLSARHLDICLPGMTVPLYDSLLAAHGIHRNLVVTLNHYTVALAVLAESDYIAVLPTSLLDLSPYARKLCQREPPISMPVRPLGVIWHQRHERSGPHMWLRQTVIDLFDKSQTQPS